MTFDGLAQARSLLTGLSGLTDSRLASAPTPELVRVGAELWEIIQVAKSQIESIKDALRKRTPQTKGQHLLKGPGASCLVTVQDTQPLLRKDLQVRHFRAILGADFDRLFEVTEVVTIRDSFEEAFQQVDPIRRPAVMAAIDLTNPKPRVSFQLQGTT